MTEDVRTEDLDLSGDEALDRTSNRAAATAVYCILCG